MTTNSPATSPALPGGSRARVYPTAECEQIFDGLPAPARDELQGVYRGRLTAVPGLASLRSGRLGGALSTVLTNLRFPWFGKSFDGPSGANVWFTSTGRFTRFSYDLQYTATELRMSYERPDNPRLLRGLSAEVRSLAPGRYLCRARWRGTVVLYFTLEA